MGLDFDEKLVDEQFKSYDDILKPDWFSDLLVKCYPDGQQEKAKLKDWYSDISEINLSDKIPKVIREQYGVAKNILLYSWFSYRMRMVALLYSFSVLENALRERFSKTKDKSFGLFTLLKKAVEEGILNDSGFHMTKHREIVVAEHKQGDSIYKNIEYIEIPESDRKKSTQYIEGLCKAIPRLRNALAHGSNMLDSDIITPMYVNAEIINMLFEGSNDNQNSN